jgi:DNA-binding NarL/FixJ family response regulator
LTRVPVILHERLGNWIRQLRPRLYEQPVRWFESRSTRELEVLLTGLAFPVVLIDLGRHTAAGLKDLTLVSLRVPNARILALDPEGQAEVAVTARELGATHVFSGFVPPPVIAELMAHWITAARKGIELAGWSRTSFPDTETDPWSWLSDYLDEPLKRDAKPATSPPWPGRTLAADRRSGRP